MAAAQLMTFYRGVDKTQRQHDLMRDKEEMVTELRLHSIAAEPFSCSYYNSDTFDKKNKYISNGRNISYLILSRLHNFGSE